MNYVLIGSAALVGILVLIQLLRNADLRKVVRYMRYIVGGSVALLTAFLLVRGQVGIASITGYLAFAILKYGRIGPWSFESATLSEDNESAVRSRFISMSLDHDTGEVEGRVVAAGFRRGVVETVVDVPGVGHLTVVEASQGPRAAEALPAPGETLRLAADGAAIAVVPA